VTVEVENDEVIIAFFREWKERHLEIWHGDIGR
jgi:hypothetical protein